MYTNQEANEKKSCRKHQNTLKSHLIVFVVLVPEIKQFCKFYIEQICFCAKMKMLSRLV